MACKTIFIFAGQITFSLPWPYLFLNCRGLVYHRNNALTTCISLFHAKLVYLTTVGYDLNLNIKVFRQQNNLDFSLNLMLISDQSFPLLS